jgi:hypothetical protein
MFGGALRGGKRLTYLLRMVGVAGVMALVFGAGSAFGALGSPQPTTYYGCLQVGGLLSNVGTTPPRRCGPTGRLISWGAEGPAGATGPSGPSGPSGANGVSHGYVVHTGVTAYTNAGLSSSLTVATLSGLPAGTYMVTASETASLPVTTDAQFPEPGAVITCTLSPGGGHSMQGMEIEGAAGVYANEQNVVVPDAVTIATGEDITYDCTGPAGTSSDNAVITAIAVDVVN